MTRALLSVCPVRDVIVAALILGVLLQDPVCADEPRVLLEVGRDAPETRLFSVCDVHCDIDGAPLLAVAGFMNNGEADMADLAVYKIGETGAVLQWRLLRGGPQSSSIRTLRSADLDGDGCDELVALGRNGHEDADSRGELQVFRSAGGQWLPAAAELWQSGRYTHGYGMDVGDLDGDGRQEIVTGGFFAAGDRERAELRVWRLIDGGLELLASASWGSEAGNARINSVRVGDLTGDGPIEIVTAGRTGQVQEEHEVNLQEADELIVWRWERSELVRTATFDGDLQSRSRLRELRLADIDGRPGLELLTVGRREAPQRGGRGRGDGTGGGRGDGTGGGRGRPSHSVVMRPTFSVFRLAEGALERIAEADFGGAKGEVRDVCVIPNADGAPGIVTITADDLKPQRNAALDDWGWNAGSLQHRARRTASLGDETRARQLIAWKSPNGPRILTIGFVQRDGQTLGQILDWGTVVASDRESR